MAKPHSQRPEDTLAAFEVDPSRGLEHHVVHVRQRQYGRNRLDQKRGKGPLRILADQFKSVIIILLALAALASAALGRVVEGLAIAAALVVNAAIGFIMEAQSQRSVQALRRLGEAKTRVRRNGAERAVPADRLVPGDIVLLDAGDMIPADARLVEANNVLADEAPLTGESTPVGKDVDALPEDTPLGGRSNMLYKGTALTQGTVTAVVTATGMDTEIGRISAMVEAAREERTPLERRLDQLGRRLTALTVVVAVAVTGLGLVAGKPALTMIETALALAIAAVPEGLPVVATIALARGMRRMAARQALVKQLSAVETLGAANLIFTDKTGTLTENRMVVSRLVLGEGTYRFDEHDGYFYADDQPVVVERAPLLRTVIEVAVLCNNASLNADGGGLGDPIEVALLRAGHAAGVGRDALLDRLPEVREVAFDPARKMMATVHRSGENYWFAVKGAPETVIETCTGISKGGEPRAVDDEARASWRQRAEAMADEGLRVLAFAVKVDDQAEADPYSGLALLALVGLYDPPREQAGEAVASCQRAGIRVVMITGDHPATARSIARSLGIAKEGDPEPVLPGEVGDLDDAEETTRSRLFSAPVFARVTPEEKLRLVTLFQHNGHVVAMTGDGINDAPALKKADIGIAMGERGTDVAREAADMVLRDDAFASIVAAIELGRAIFNNIRKFIVYLLSGNLAEIIAVSLTAAVAAPLPLLPLQILFINFVSDVLPALALGVGAGPPDIMDDPPRDPREPVLKATHWSAVVGYGVIIAAVVLGIFAYVLLTDTLTAEQAVTISFLTFGFARLWHVLNMRDPKSHMWVNEITVNRFVWASVALGAVLLIAAVYLPGLNTALGTAAPGAQGWSLILAVSLVPVVIVQVMKRAGVLWERHF